jgi:hypothetical protein
VGSIESDANFIANARVHALTSISCNYASHLSRPSSNCVAAQAAMTRPRRHGALHRQCCSGSRLRVSRHAVGIFGIALSLVAVTFLRLSRFLRLDVLSFNAVPHEFERMIPRRNICNLALIHKRPALSPCDSTQRCTGSFDELFALEQAVKRYTDKSR